MQIRCSSPLKGYVSLMSFMKRRRKNIIKRAFDSQWYLSTNPDVAESGLEPLEHYIQFGEEEGRRPRAQFDPQTYAALNPDVPGSGIGLFEHSLIFGKKEGRKGLSGHQRDYDVVSSRLDRDWYLITNPDVAASGLDPVIHYIEFGEREGRRPSPDFDPGTYGVLHPDVRESGGGLFAHYLLFGKKEGQKDLSSPRCDDDVVMQNFNRDWYLMTNPDVAENGVDPVAHYIEFGEKEGRQPSPDFDPITYESFNPDVRDSGMGLFEHFLLYGANEGRKGIVSSSLLGHQDQLERYDDRLADDAQYATRRALVENSSLWDPEWYGSNYESHVRSWRLRNKGDILDHFLREGGRAGFLPSEKFSLTNLERDYSLDPLTDYLTRIRFMSYHFLDDRWEPRQAVIEHYWQAKQSRKNCAGVVYTAIIDGYDSLKQPFFVDVEWDYICFTDDADLLKKRTVGVWEIRQAEVKDLDSSRLNRWHKIHPHVLFPDYELSIYIDGNVRLISSYAQELAKDPKSIFLLPSHHTRDCIYAEASALEMSGRLNVEQLSKLKAQLNVLKVNGFPENFGLTENNVIIRRHHEIEVKSIAAHWWRIVRDYSHRDQASISYVLWKHGVSPKAISFPNARSLPEDFWLSRHVVDVEPSGTVQSLRPAFGPGQVTVVLSCNSTFVDFMAVMLNSLVLNSNVNRNYDLIVLESDVSSEQKITIENLFSGMDNFSLRFFNMKKAQAKWFKTDVFVDGYVPAETYNKLLLPNLLDGFEKVVYIDTDVILNEDIANLVDVDLFGNAAGACRNIVNIHAANINKAIKGFKFGDYIRDFLGVTRNEDYFQAGVMVIDLKHPLVTNMTEKCLEIMGRLKKPIFFDQCIVNSYFYGHVRFLPQKWNHIWYAQRYSYLKYTVSFDLFNDYARARLNPSIVHYASKDKPYNTFGWRLGEAFWRYASNTPYLDLLLKRAESHWETAEGGAVVDYPRLCEIRTARVLIHLHVFYSDQIPYFLEKLRNVHSCDCQLFVTYVDKAVAAELTEFERLFESVELMHVENAGFDIFPFLKVVRNVCLSDFDYVLKLHTKNRRDAERSTVYSVEVPEYVWRDQLVDALLSSREKWLSLLRILAENRSIGAIAAKEFIFSIDENNERANYNLVEEMTALGLDAGSHYVGGSMFLSRAYPFERLEFWKPSADIDESKCLVSGGHKSNAHVVERLLGLVIENDGFEILGA